jgi:peptidoglycan/LPS O-acetylase OafA/YrhL
MPSRGIALLVGVGLISLAFRAFEVYHPAHPSPIWRASTIATFLFIVAGMIAAIVHVQWQTQRPSWLRGWVARSDLWLLAAVPFFVAFAFGRYHFDFGCTVMAFLIIGAASFPGLERGPVTRILWWRPLAVIGISAYSIYLWHVPLIVLLLDWGVVSRDWGFAPFAAVVLPLSLLVGQLSYRVIEEPFLRMRKRWSRAGPVQSREGSAAQEAPAG